MNGINPRLLLALATSAAALTLSTVAAAQGRFSARVELGAALPLTSPQSNDFGLGFAGRGDVGLRVAGPLHLHAYGAYMRWPASSASTQVGNTASAAATLLGGGLSIEPALTSRVRLRLEGDVGVSLNGAGSDTRLTWGGGVGAWFGVGDVVDLDGVPGGGTLPTVTIASAGLRLDGDHSTALRTPPRPALPVIARVADGATLIDLRTVDPADDHCVGEAVRRCLAT